MYDCMKTLRRIILENIKWPSTIYRQNLYNYINEINLCLCYLLYLNKIATIKNKSNFSYLNTNQKPVAYCPIMPALVPADSL